METLHRGAGSSNIPTLCAVMLLMLLLLLPWQTISGNVQGWSSCNKHPAISSPMIALPLLTLLPSLLTEVSRTPSATRCHMPMYA
jgi:hypothetical protein